MIRLVFAMLSVALLASCRPVPPDQDNPQTLTREAMLARKAAAQQRFPLKASGGPYTGLAAELSAQGLVDVQAMDPVILVDLAYASANNFLDTALYGTMQTAFLQLEAAAMLSLAQDELSRRKPDYRLLVYDAARPRRVQQKMWQRVSGTPMAPYVANPDAGSLHNYGAAVDLTLADSSGTPLDMGTPFDFFGPLAEPRHEARFLASGALSQAQYNNRRLLREVMQYAGFQPIANEWWHFNAFSLRHAQKNYPIIE
jgi:D-alanyl-D-alanine dipeptidase